MRRIHVLIFSIVAVALVVLTIVLGTLHTLQERDAMEEATYQQGQIAASSLREATGAIQAVLASVQQVPGVQENLNQSQMVILMLRLADQNLYTFVKDNQNIQFASLLSTSSDVFLHSNPALVGQPANEIGLQDVPVDRLSRRSVTGYGEVYVTRIHMTVGEPLEAAEFDIIVGMPTDPVDDAVQDSIMTAILATLGILFLMTLPTFLLIHFQVVMPLQTLTSDVKRLGASQLEHPVSVRGSHEIRALAHTVNHQAQRWQESRRELETLYHSAETRLVNRARDIEISAQIMRIATSLRDVNTLLRETVTQVRDRFDVIYHAQVFLLDDVREFAVLVASTSAAGEQLLALGHKLEIGSESLIGRVTSAGTTVIASDTRRGEVPWQPNPLLPSTRSEMALPLMIQGRVIGALDVQSIAPDVFTEDIMRTFEVLADQLAIAIENARLLAETQQRIAQINALNRRMTHATWDEFVAEDRRQKPQGYSYDLTQMSPLNADTPLPDDVPVAEVPIRVHGETVGTLMTTLPSSGRMTADDRLLVEAVADRVALAIENARLFEQTQRALTETERLYETARTVSSAIDLDAIYQMVIEQLSTSAHTDHIAILRSGPDPMLVQYLEEVFTWDHQQTAEMPSATRITVPPLTYTEADPLPIVAPVDYPDTQYDLPADHPLAAWLAEHKLRSVVLAPITAGGRWFGLLVIGTQDPGGFDATYVSFAGAMADQLALAIENRRLFEEAQIEARRARALAEAGQLASQIGVDLEAGLRSLFRAVSGPGNYDRWWFGLLSEDRTTLQQVVAEGITSAQTVNLAQDENALAEAARIGQIVLINDPHDHPLTADQPPEIAEAWGKHIAMPVRIGDELVGVLLIGRSLDEANLDERDIQLAATLASQIAVATENQNLFTEVESQRQRLQVIVDSMPTGILVMDRAGRVVLSNQNLTRLLGPEMRPSTSEHPQPYPVVQADTGEDYPREKWPLSRVFETGEPASVDDMTIIQPDGTQINVLAQAAPIYDAQGNVTAVVGAFQDITDLQELERALQDSLRETTLLYEASRSISRATTLEELLKATLWHMSTLQPDQAFIFLAHKDDEHQLRGTLAAAQPEMDLSDCHDNIFDGMFGDEPIIITRDTATPEAAACLDELGLLALSSFPLSVRGQISGWMMIGFRSAQTITTEQRRFMTTIADQAAVTIENQRLLLQTADALEETAILYHASRAVSDAETPAAVLDAFVHHASTHSVAYAALYILLGESAETSFAAVELVAQLGTPAAAIGTRYRADQFALWDTIHSDEVILVNHLTADTTLTAEAREQFTALGLQSILIIPLRTGERVVGALVLGRNEQWADDEAEIRVYETLADQATVALENVRLLSQSQRRARQLGTSAQISRAVTSILHLDDLLPQVVIQIRDAFEYDHVQVFLISDDGERAELVASTGEAGKKLLELKHYLPVGSRSVIGQVTETGEPQIALDTADARVVHRPNPILPHTRSEMALPLIARGQIVGALDVQSNNSGAFTDEDAGILAALADMVATAIDNARLFEIAEQRAEEMAFLFSITTAAATSSDLDDALQQVVHTLRATLNVSSASVYVPDESGETLVRGADAGSPRDDTDNTAADIDRGLIEWVARHKEPVVIGDVTQDPRRLTNAEHIGSVIAVPLVTGGALAGVLIVTSDELHGFDDEDVRLLQTLSSSLAAIIQNQRLLREVQEANEQLLEVDRLKTNFLAAMSHELRTPLNSIIGFSRLLVKGMGGPLSDPQREDLTTIYESGKHLLGLVNDILDQAKLEAGKMELSHGIFKVQDVVKGVMSSAIGLTRDKGLKLHTEMAQDVPDAYGDEFRTRQVLLNLVSNASKFTDEGSITVSVRPIVEQGRIFIHVAVIDTGIGIAEKDMPKLFEAFQQVDSSLTRKVGGTGMGLPLAKSFTELQGGRIWVESTVGAGSTFHITIPTQPQSDNVGVIDDDPEASTLTAVEQPQSPKSTPMPSNLTPNPDMESDGMPKTSTPPKTALIVEDNEGVMDLYRRCLEPLGYTVIGVTDPGSVRYTLAARPDVIVIDVHMRDGAGWGVLEDLVHRTTIPIVVCSIDTDRERGLAFGVVEYILKPFSEDQLANAVLRAETVAQRQRILLVDDHPETVRVFREALEATQRYRVFEVTSGAAALLLMQEPPHVDLVILDLRMPELDGFEVLQAIRADARTADIPVLVLTADEVNDSERVVLQSIDMYRKDDIDEERLLHQVQAQLNPNGEIE
jgi:PAS domain S-box-containing protein